MALAGLIAFLGVARLVVRTRQTKPAGKRGLAEAAILRLASRELEAVQRAAEGQGWNDDLVARALAAARIAAASALGRPVHQEQAVDAQSGDGRLLAGGWPRRKPTLISGAATAGDLSRALAKMPVTADPARRQLLDDLRHALATFTAAQYAREAALDRSALDEALARAIAATRRLRADRAWPKSYLRRWTPHLQPQQQA
jgi:hypothetical protein